MKMISIAVLLLGLQSFQALRAASENSAPCRPQIKVERYSDFESIEKHLEWHGADNSLMQKAACKNKQVLNPEEMDEFIAKKAYTKKGTGNFSAHGVSFKDESPVLIAAFKNLTTAMDSFGLYNQPKDQKNFQKQYSINPDCKKVECAVKKIWGEELGRKILYVYLKHNFNTSEFAFGNSDRLNVDEMDDVILGLEDLPKHLIPLGSNNQRLTHFSRGYRLRNDPDNVAANSLIMLFDVWTNEPRFERQYSVFHELSHNIGTKLNKLDLSPTWLKFSGWVKKGDDWAKNPKACFVTGYSLASPYEDFAEAMSTYRYNPKGFKNKCPEKYNFLKEKVFKGLEYTSNESCVEIPAAKIQAIVNEILPELQHSLEVINIDQNLIKEKCSGAFNHYPVQDENVNQCKAEILKDQLNKMDADQLKGILKKNNVEVDSARMPLLKTSISENIIGKNNFVESTEKIKMIAEESFNNLIQENIPKRVNGTLSGIEFPSIFSFSFSQKCRNERWSADAMAPKKCAINMLIGEDKYWSKLGMSRYFKKLQLPEELDEESRAALYEKYFAEIEKSLLETDVLDPILLKSKQEIKKEMSQHFSYSSYDFYKAKSGWKKMEPKEFCSKFYNNPSDYIKKYILPVGATEVPGFASWCEEKQSEKRKRYEFSEKELNEWLDSAIK